MIQAELAELAAPPLSLATLATQMRVHDRLDWWDLESWRDSDALIAIPSPQNETLAALLAVPIEFADMNNLASACGSVAWLRWCAVADEHSPSALLRALMAIAEVRLRKAKLQELWCVCEPHGWLATNLRDLGFKKRDELITMSRLARKPANWVLPKHTTLRVLHPALLDEQTLTAIHALDSIAFAPPWRYSAYVLRRAFLQSCHVTLAEQDGRVVGYQCSIYDGDAIAHITRLVVHPAAQRGGVGAALFGDAVGELLRIGAREITLNTPASNVHAQRLYKRFDFKPLAERMTVLCKELV